MSSIICELEVYSYGGLEIISLNELVKEINWIIANPDYPNGYYVIIGKDNKTLRIIHGFQYKETVREEL